MKKKDVDMYVIREEDVEEMIQDRVELLVTEARAEVATGIYKVVTQLQKEKIPDSMIIEKLLILCVSLIEESPESAMEFSKELEKKLELG